MDCGCPRRDGARFRDPRDRARSRVRLRPAPGRRNRWRASPAAGPSRRRARFAGPLDPRSVRRRRRRGLCLGSRRGRHEESRRDGARGGPAPGRRSTSGRSQRSERSDPRPDPRHPVRQHGRRGGRRSERDRLDRGRSAGAPPGRGRDQRVRRGCDDIRATAFLPDRRRREGLCGLPPDGPRRVGPRLDAPRRQRGGPRGPGRRPPGGPGPTSAHAGDADLPWRPGA